MAKSEYIDRKQLLHSLEIQWQQFRKKEIDHINITKLIESQPAADVVEVVCCKDCKYYEAVIFSGKPMHYGYCINKHDVSPNTKHRFMLDFCSYGIRKDT